MAQLDAGVEELAAREAAASYAGALSSGDLQAGMRGGLGEAVRVAGKEPSGWRKSLSGDPCDWCRLVGAERVYYAADRVPFHDRDSCGVAPVYEREITWRPRVGRVLTPAG